MRSNTEYPRDLVPAITILAAALASTLVTFMPAHSILPIGMGDGMLLALIALHFTWALQLGGDLLRDRRPDAEHLTRVAEVLFFFGSFLFLFAYVYASNANMDYVQRFVAGGGTIQLAPDTRTERLLVTGRFGPFLVVDLVLWVWGHRKMAIPRGISSTDEWSDRYAPALMILAVVLSVLSYPSFIDIEGFSVLGWFALTPLFVLLRRQVARGRYLRATWYGVLYGVLFTLLGNYWLGTFNLISLQAVGVIFFVFYLLYVPVAVTVLALLERTRPQSPHRLRVVFGVLRALILPLSWTAFELLRSSGFLGYPWLLAAHSQYRHPMLIQTARWGGVWMVSFMVLLVNALLAEAVIAGRPTTGGAVRRRRFRVRRSLPWLGATLVVFTANVLVGAVALGREAGATQQVRIALIQQNSDPRKHDYQRTFASLTRLTDAVLGDDPDLVVWSETAFVPNIRRWSREDPDRYPLARLVEQFNGYLGTVDTWLLTGNDDYRRVLDDDGREITRDSYNAAVLFSDTGQRMETYHKVKLVPFTEHFPYRDALPWVYDLLMSVDIHFWAPGTEYTVFHHPDFSFATPICFEDAFPGVVRRFALEGMEVIVNITNDYWSLREQAAQQHFAAALFRTVELGMPMVRSTASGVTVQIDAAGRIVATVPQYSEQYLLAEVALPGRGDVEQEPPSTLYQRGGDWFPLLALALLGVIALGGIVRLMGVER